MIATRPPCRRRGGRGSRPRARAAIVNRGLGAGAGAGVFPAIYRRHDKAFVLDPVAVAARRARPARRLCAGRAARRHAHRDLDARRPRREHHPGRHGGRRAGRRGAGRLRPARARHHPTAARRRAVGCLRPAHGSRCCRISASPDAVARYRAPRGPAPAGADRASAWRRLSAATGRRGAGPGSPACRRRGRRGNAPTARDGC